MTTITEGFVGISDFNQYGQGWEWVAMFNEYCNRTHEIKQIARTFRTNTQGNGLWIDGKQVRGTAQFNMPYERKAARAKARRLCDNGSW